MRGVAADDWRMRECMAVGMEGTWWTGAPASSGTAVAAPARGWEKRETDRRAKAWATAPPLGISVCHVGGQAKFTGIRYLRLKRRFRLPLILICIQNNKEPRRLRLFDVTVVERSQ